MIWLKTIAGLRAWFEEKFSRKGVERYFIYTFVYHSYTIITNTLMFSLKSKFYGKWILPNIIFTILIGGTFILILYKFTLFKDKDQRLH
jgi:hypothetical protein